MAVLSFIVSAATAGVGVFFDFDADNCNRLHSGNYWFRVVTSTTFYLIPFSLAGYLLLDTIYTMSTRVTTLIRVSRFQKFLIDKALTKVHFACLTLHGAAWLPYLILVNHYPNATDATFYAFIWIGMTRSTLTSYMYCTLDVNFREAFKIVFNYCCCKGPIPQPSNVPEELPVPCIV